MEELIRLKEIIKKLRSPDGCPWDMEQTHESLRPLLLEEAHEALEALSKNDMDNFKEELGDLLLHIFLHAEIASETNTFNINGIARGISDKLIRRHPHVFGDVKVNSKEEVTINWERIKKEEKKGKNSAQNNPFENIPKGMGALLRSVKLGKTAAKMHFDWESISGIKEKIIEEIDEMDERINDDPNNKNEIKAEFGDLLFALCQWARHNKIDAEDALLLTNAKFERRFIQMMEIFKSKDNKTEEDFKILSIEEKERYWQKAKKDVSQE